MYLSELQTKEIINVDNGKRLGRIIDVEINENKINNIIIEFRKSIINIFKKPESISVKWNMIKKIGDDVILVTSDINEQKVE